MISLSHPEESSWTIGQATGRREDINEVILNNCYLCMDIGALKEKIRTFEKENKKITKRKAKDPSSVPSTSGESPEYMNIDSDIIIVKNEKPGTSYAKKVSKSKEKPVKRREPFLALKTPVKLHTPQRDVAFIKNQVGCKQIKDSVIYNKVYNTL